MRAYKCRYGFTLVELLVVVSIIALLVALLTPALNKVKAGALRTSCQSQLQGMQLGQIDFANDNRGKISTRRRIYGTVMVWRPAAYGWTGVGLLWSKGYLENPETMWCPANINPVTAFDGIYGFRSSPGVAVSQEVKDAAGFWYPMIKNTYTQRDAIKRLSAPGQSGGSAMMADGFTYSRPDTWGRWGGHYWDPFEGYAVRSHHKTGYNVAYLDGSVTFYSDPDEDIAYKRLKDVWWNDTDWDRMEDEVWTLLFDQ